ncbi:MAG: lytic transglycosylase domain-containing protein [Clostridia bacterium]|nr:lytic transglycosylase domain-containing protein [Clostridia bacterium]
MKKFSFLNSAIAIFLVGIVLVGFSIFRKVEKKYFYPLEHVEIIYKHASTYKLSPTLVVSLINAESSFNSQAISEKGAKGLMQITDSTAEYIAGKLGEEEYNIFDENTNILFGCYYLRYLLDKFKVEETALCAYNAGETKVREWLRNKEYSLDSERLKVIPYKETKNYIERIYKNKVKYKKLYKNILDK